MPATELTAKLLIRQLVEDYALAADDADGARATTLFAPDGVMHIHMDPMHPAEHSTTVAADMPRTWESLKVYAATTHIIAAHAATLDGPDAATGVTRCVAHHVRDWPNGRTDTVMHIKYEDRFVRIDGAWLFSERRLHMKALATGSILD